MTKGINFELLTHKGLTLLGTFGGWILFVNAVYAYLNNGGGELLMAGYQDLLVISFALGLIGFISGIGSCSKNPVKCEDGKTGMKFLLAICTFSSALVVMACLALIVITPELKEWLITKFP